MECIKWNENLRLGVKIIDEQHKRLITHMNDLYDNIGMNKKESFHQIMEGINDYRRTHFVVEEEFMIIYDYEGYELHKNSHNTFKKKVASLSTEFQKDDLDKARDILFYLFEWLRSHLLEEDKELVAFLISKGVN